MRSSSGAPSRPGCASDFPVARARFLPAGEVRGGLAAAVPALHGQGSAQLSRSRRQRGCGGPGAAGKCSGEHGAPGRGHACSIARSSDTRIHGVSLEDVTLGPHESYKPCAWRAGAEPQGRDETSGCRAEAGESGGCLGCSRRVARPPAQGGVRRHCVGSVEAKVLKSLPFVTWTVLCSSLACF